MAASHSLTVWSARGGEGPPVGAERHARSPRRCAGERRPELPVGRHVPEPDRLVVAGGGERAAVGAERHARPHVGVAGERRAEPAAVASVPQPHRPVVAGGGERLPSGLNATLST